MTREAFQEALLVTLDRKDHRAWRRWTGPGVTRDQLRVSFEQEWLVFVRDFPRLLGRVHGNCPVPEVRRALAANLYEEDTGGLSHGRPHPELFLDQMEALGFARAGFDAVRLLPESAAYRAFIDLATTGPWVVGAAIATLWIEGSVNERRALAGEEEEPLEARLAGHYLVRHHGLRPEQLSLPKAHAEVERGHRHDAWRIVLGHADTPHLQQDVLEAMETACALWHLYRDGVTKAAGLGG